MHAATASIWVAHWGEIKSLIGLLLDPAVDGKGPDQVVPIGLNGWRPTEQVVTAPVRQVARMGIQRLWGGAEPSCASRAAASRPA